MDQIPPRQKVVAFDFDGVIANYKGFTTKDAVLEPRADVVNSMKQLRDKNFKILIHSTRGDEFLKKYCDTYDIPYDYINHRPDKQGDNPGKPIAYVYVDDRALSYQGQSTEELVSQIENFKSYWE
jgi:hypothetical protein